MSSMYFHSRFSYVAGDNTTGLANSCGLSCQEEEWQWKVVAMKISNTDFIYFKTA